MSKFKKTLLLTMLLAVFAPWAANAQNTVKATCDPITNLPWVENFDKYEYTGNDSYSVPSTYPNDQLPDCWKFINRSGSTNTYPQAYICNSTDFAASGNCLFFRSSSTTPLYAVLPQFSTNISDLKLSFTYRNEALGTSNGTLYVSYMTDPNDANTFNEGAAIACDITMNKTKMDVVFNNAPAGSYFAFKYQGGGNNHFLAIDDVTVKNRVVVVANQIVASNPGLNQMTWNQFAQHVNDGAEFPFDIYLMEDITINTMAGTEDNPFTGTFNGYNYTITVNLTAADDNFTAPFRFIKNATIQKLKVTGTINDDGHKFCAGFAGDCYGNNTFTNCLSDVTINASINGDGTHGGFIARNNGGSRTGDNLYTTTFEGCAFTGKLLGENTNQCGGFCGWSEYYFDFYARTTFNNCVFAPQEVTMSTTGSATFARCRNTSYLTFSNCYFMRDFNDGNNNTGQGKHAYSITGVGGVHVAISETSYDSYNVSDINAFTTGILYNSNLYAGEGDEVNLLLSRPGYLVTAYTASGGTLSEGTPTGTNDAYTLTMPSDDVTISATAYINRIASADDWEVFCTTVNNGYNYSGKTVTMTGNVGTAENPVSTMVGIPGNNNTEKCFSGIFDGGGHTLTFSQTVSDQYCAPFRRINNATIQNLKTAGSISISSGRYAAGIVAYSKGESTITNCISSMVITSTVDDDAACSGIAGQCVGTINISGCVFDGQMKGGKNNWGGMVGYIRDGATASISNCLFVPESIMVGTGCSTFARDRGGSPILGFTNCYYNAEGAKMSTKQGKQAYTITGAEGVYVDISETSYNENYYVSGITAYTTGIIYNENIYAGENDEVSLNLGTTVLPGYDVNYAASPGTLTGSANPYTLTMPVPAENVTITATTSVAEWEIEGRGDDWDHAYLIYNNAQLDTLATRVNNGNDYSNKYFKVMADITYDANVADNFTAIGFTIDNLYNYYFNGHFDGNGYTISGINSVDYGPGFSNGTYGNGLFGHLESSAEVKNIILTNSTIDNGRYCGGIVGWNNGGTVTNCHVTSTVTIKGDFSASMFLGGIMGYNKGSGSVSQCTFAGTLTKPTSGPYSEFGYFYGGIAGYNEPNATMSDNLVIGATIPTITNAMPGAVVGGNRGGTLARNYYVNCTVAGTANAIGVGCNNYQDQDHNFVQCDLTDNDGAMPGNARTITAPTDWTVQNPDGWAFIASPVEGSIAPSTVENLLGTQDSETGLYNYDLYRYNPLANLEWENYVTPAHHDDFNLVNGMGYLYAKQDGATLTFTGTLNMNDTKQVTSLPQGFNLVGNPFPRAAWIDRSYYILNDDGSAVSSSESNGYISPCHGVIVDINADDLANETNYATFTTTPTAQQSSNNGNLTVTLAQSVTTRGSAETKILDNAIVSFNEGSQLGKFYFGMQNANIYIPQNGKDYAIAYSNGQGEMPVNFKAKENGQYTINVNPENVEMSYLHLIDNLTGADIDLLQTPSYTFNAKTTDYESRFRLVFASATENEDGGNDSFAFFSNGQYIIANEGQATLQVIDIMGRILSSETINGSVSKSINQPAGVYMIRLINGEKVRVQKIIIH